MKEIRIRELSLEEARWKLESELNEAFMSGETRVAILHGIGTGRLKRLTEEVARNYDFVENINDYIIYKNPGVTVLELHPPDPGKLRKLKGG